MAVRKIFNQQWGKILSISSSLRKGIILCKNAITDVRINPLDKWQDLQSMVLCKLNKPFSRNGIWIQLSQGFQKIDVD